MFDVGVGSVGAEKRCIIEKVTKTNINRSWKSLSSHYLCFDFQLHIRFLRDLFSTFSFSLSSSSFSFSIRNLFGEENEDLEERGEGRSKNYEKVLVGSWTQEN